MRRRIIHCSTSKIYPFYETYPYQFDIPFEATVPVHKVSLAEAKAWMIKGIPAHQIQAQGEILWDLAEETDFGGAPLLTVPMLPADNNEQILMKKDGSFTKSLVSTQRILFYTDATGNTKASIIKTENNQNDNLKNYTGNLHFFDPKTNAAQATWQLKNDSFVGSVSFENTAKNTRTSGCSWELYEVHCGDQCTGQLGGADNGDYLPDLTEGCCYKYKGCGSGPSEPSNPSPYIPIFNPTSPSIGGGNGGILGGTGGIGGGIFGSSLIPIITSLSNGTISFLSETSSRGLSFTSSEILQLDRYPFIRNLILDFILEYNTNSVQTAENVLTLQLGRRINDSEKQILTNKGIFTYRINVILYAMNALRATNWTRIYYGENGAFCPYCKGNAFKHAMFRILDADVFGYQMSKELGDAHESTSPRESDLNRLEIEMDLFNNSVGLSIFTNNIQYYLPTYIGALKAANDWASILKQQMEDGHLKFIRGNDLVPLSYPCS